MTDSDSRPARRGEFVRDGIEFTRMALGRFRNERGLVVAASLSYTSLLAMVPLIAIALSVLSAFPAFEDIERRLIELALSYAAPHAEGDVESYLERFVANTSKLTPVGVVWLAITAIMLLSTIEAAFNAIWRIESPRPLLVRLIAYWTTLTLGPLLIGAALSLSTVLFAVGNLTWLGFDAEFLHGGLVRLLPLALTAVGLTVLYLALPHRRVEWRHALLGGVVAALLFEGLKFGFGLYVNRVGTLESIYGPLSALPVFLIWMYLGWAVVLFGAAVAAARPEWLASRIATSRGPLTPARCLVRALQVIDCLHAAGRDGRAVSNDALLVAAGGDGDGLAAVMAPLLAAGYVARTEADTVVLARDLDGVTVYDVYRELGFAIDATAGQGIGEQPWAAQLAALLAQAQSAGREALATPVKTLLAAAAPRLVVDDSDRAGS